MRVERDLDGVGGDIRGWGRTVEAGISDGVKVDVCVEIMFAS